MLGLARQVPLGVCRDFEQSSRLEWLDTNHTGAYAMGTVAGVNTRRYHAALISSLHPPTTRICTISRLEEQLFVNGERFELSTAQFPGAVAPAGYQFLNEFSLNPFPTWRFSAGGVEIEKQLCVLDNEQSVLICYQIKESSGNKNCTLKVRPFFAFSDYHSLAHYNSGLNSAVTSEDGRVSVRPYPDLPKLTMHNNAERFEAKAEWFYKHEYLRELDRGLDFQEDLFALGTMTFEAEPGQRLWLLATLEGARHTSRLDIDGIEAIRDCEANRRSQITVLANAAHSEWVRALDQFRVVRADGQPTLVAGYPWFTDWSRDMLISLPGIMAAGYPLEESRGVLEMLLAQRSQGLLPNRFSDKQSAPEYNNVDGTLWFFVAAHEYFSRSGDIPFLRDVVYPASQDILGWHFEGTRYGIKVDPADHLLRAGETGTQLTWMDAKIGDYVVTPRLGKPVEINALWYNALQTMAAWARVLLSGREEEYRKAAEEVKNSFNNQFWNPRLDCLFDVLTDSGPDCSIRPNQLFAASLPFPVIDRIRAASVVKVAQDKLLTPFGLRTLAPQDPQYRPTFNGGVHDRDSAYHQGTVWPWLIGAFVEAYLYAHGENEATLLFGRQCLRPFLRNQPLCLGSIAEVYDGNAPHHPAGCPAQLWSVAEVFRAATRCSGSV